MKNKKTGFTLIEMLVSVSLFTIVALIVSTVLVSMTTSYRQAQSIKEVVDNVASAMDIMTLDLRESAGGFDCDSSDCTRISPGRSIGEGAAKRYYLDNGVIIQDFGLGDKISLTSDNVEIEKLEFLIKDSFPPAVRINIKGAGEGRFGNSVNFNLQTTVTQRN